MNLLKILYKFSPIIPKPIWKIGAGIYHLYQKKRYLKGKRPNVAGETTKARNRRLRENFFEKYCSGSGLDIGYGGDLICPNALGWDWEHGDAQYLNGLNNEQFDFVYSSHTLEHLQNPAEAIKNWFRVVKPGGFLILYIPHRDLYEKKSTLPSRFNPNHTAFFIIEKDEPPNTIGIVPLIHRTLSNFEIVYAKQCDEGHTKTDPLIHSDGEYSIEVVIRKLVVNQ
jgi:SAM-dependent methyltransferase